MERKKLLGVEYIKAQSEEFAKENIFYWLYTLEGRKEKR